MYSLFDPELPMVKVSLTEEIQSLERRRHDLLFFCYPEFPSLLTDMHFPLFQELRKEGQWLFTPAGTARLLRDPLPRRHAGSRVFTIKFPFPSFPLFFFPLFFRTVLSEGLVPALMGRAA